MAKVGQGAPPLSMQAALARGARVPFIAGAALVWSLLLAVVIMALTLVRPFFTLALAIASAGGFVVTAAFAFSDEWRDAASAAVVAIGSGAAFAAYAVLASWLDPQFFRRARRRRWRD